MKIDPIIQGLLAVILIWEVTKFYVGWREQAFVFAGIRFGRHTTPRRFWALLWFYLLMTAFIAAVLLQLVGVWRS